MCHDRQTKMANRRSKESSEICENISPRSSKGSAWLRLECREEASRCFSCSISNASPPVRVGSRSEWDPKPYCRCTKAPSPTYLSVARKRGQRAYFLPGSFHRRSLFASEASFKRQEDGPKGWLECRRPDRRGTLCISRNI